MSQRIKVLAPATISNMNCGFDVLGAALNVTCDEIIAERIDQPGVDIKLIGKYARLTPEDPKSNTAGVAVMKFIEFAGLNKEGGIRLEIKKKIKPGSGLGSSAASACAAVFAANELYGTKWHKSDLLPFAIDAEATADGSWHADNVAPCLLGGIQMVRDAKTNDIHRIHAPHGLYITVVLPDIQVLTSEARAILSDQIGMAAMIEQSANLAALTHALHTSNFDLMQRSLQDVIIEPQRKSLIKGFDDVKRAAEESGALGCGISGAGPTLFAICNNHAVAEVARKTMVEAFEKHQIDSTGYISEINHEGCVKC